MSLTVSWNAVSGATGYRLYRSAGSKVNLASPPSDVVNVGSDVTSYTYQTSVNRSIYYILVGAVLPDGNITYTEQLLLGYFTDTGPGPQKLARGDWNFGYFGEVDPNLLFSNSELYAGIVASGATTPLATQAAIPTLSVYHKFVVGGRILFTADQLYNNAAPSPGELINSKLLVKDNTYETNGVVVSKNGYDFVFRLPHATVGNPTAVLQTAQYGAEAAVSEIGMIMSLFGTGPTPMVPPAPGVNGQIKYKLCDQVMGTWMGLAWVDTQVSAANTYGYMNITSGSTGWSAISQSNLRFQGVLELLF